jgi:ABC-2 type transport system permease protein
MREFTLAALALWRRDLLHFWRERARLAGFAASPLLFWLVVGAGFGNLAFYFPGAVLLSTLFTAVFSTMSLIEDRREGFLLSVLASPAPRGALVAGKVLGGATMAAIQGLVFFAVMPWAGLAVTPARLAAGLGVLWLAGAAFTALGFAIAWYSRSAQGFHAIMNLLLLPLWMVSGALFERSTAHGAMQWVMAVNPMSYTLSSLRHALAAASADEPAAGLSLAVSAALAAACLLVSSRAVSRAAEASHQL